MSLGFASQTVGLPLAQCVAWRLDSVSVLASLRLRSHISGPSYTHVQILCQGPRALPRDTSWHLSDGPRGGHSCASAERPDSAVLWLEGWRAAWVWRWLCQRGGSDKVSALRSRTCSCPLCIFLSPFPLPTRLSIFCLQCLFLITPFMTWPGIRF